MDDAETKLRYLCRRAGFGEWVRGERIQLDLTLGTAAPETIYRADDDEQDEGSHIDSDRRGGSLHGNPATPERNYHIRGWLRSNGCEAIEISAHEPGDER